MIQEIQELYEVLTGQYGPVFETIEMWACINALSIKPVVVEDGKWLFCYQTCGAIIRGYGNTIYEAAKNFYDQIS